MGQKVGLDSSLFIYLQEENQKYLTKVESILSSVQSGKIEGVFANIGLVEIFTGPKKTQQPELFHEYRILLKTFPNLQIAELNQPVIELAADLRATYGIGTPDAIHIASALVYGADTFITNDKALKKVKEIEIQLL